MNKNKKIKFLDWMSLFPFFISQLILYPIALYTRKVIIETNSTSSILIFIFRFFEFLIFFSVTLIFPLIVFFVLGVMYDFEIRMKNVFYILGSLILIYIFLILIFNMKELLLLIGCCIVFGLGLLVK
ncbi:hypothetical protein GCWU000323_01287 [Leptotrichia hofstadii F0254]|uniref:Uncharacterized protein n=1 Tax=Leptotrichia hofstadii F0254 TaxID=634994 RepID=C9MXN9_9FUSO|nr:hypothetical protein GCWU000323_01287 [Leptotrichia hofstadii F0254]